MLFKLLRSSLLRCHSRLSGIFLKKDSGQAGVTDSVIILSNISARFLFYSLVFLWSITPFDVYAVPAAPILHTLTQPDGTTLTARQWGDERSHGWEDSEGYTIVHDEQTKHWKYAVKDIDGTLVGSSKIAGRDLPPAGISKKLRPSRQVSEQVSPLYQSAALPEKVGPPQGAIYKIPVLLINFSDTTTTYTAGNFESLLFGDSVWSMKDYYEEVSYGDFSVSAGPEGVTGWYTASKTHDYYGANVGSNDEDEWPGDLVYEAVFAANASGYDFAPYDMDGDCYVDVVNIVHQGTGEEAGGPSTDIWSHSWSLNGANYWGRSHYGKFTTSSPCTSGGFIKIDDYVIQPETLDGGQQTMGVFAHEYAHALGLPDLYDTDGSSNGVGDWSLMDSGSWNKATQYGDRPAHLDAWSKYFLGWVDPIEVSGLLTNEPIYQAEGDPDIYKFLAGTPLSGEYFLVENRQKVGFDSALPGSGLLIWHIDGSKINSNLDLNTVNNYECYQGGPSCSVSHYGVKLMQADNLWELEKSLSYGNTGDTFKSPGNTTFNATSLPNSNLYNRNNSNVRVTNISASGNPMTATLDNTPPLTPISLTSTPGTWTNTNSFSINWTNPSVPSGIAGAYYKIGAAPTSDSDGAYTTSKPFAVSATAEGEQNIYVWLKDGDDKINYSDAGSTVLYYDNSAPADGTLSASVDSLNALLSWTEFTDAGGSGISTYKLVFSTGSTPATCNDGAQIYSGSGTSYTHSPLSNATTYYYRVCAIDSSGNMSSGAINNAFVGIATTLPAEGDEYSSCSYYSPPTFLWDTDDTFSKLEIQFSIDNLFTKPTKANGIIGLNQISLSKTWKKILTMPGTAGGTVYWRVAGIKADKSMVYSNTSSFTVEALEPVSNMDISPASRSSLPTISWENNCAISFKVWFANDSDFLNKSTTMKSLSFKILNPNDNGGAFSLDLLSKEWDNIRSVVGDMSGSTIYWYVESWDKIKGYAKTSIESFVLNP